MEYVMGSACEFLILSNVEYAIRTNIGYVLSYSERQDNGESYWVLNKDLNQYAMQAFNM